MQRPDVLVLGAGGIPGARWMRGVLAGIEHATGIDFREVEAFVGTSAGSIVAADLLAGRRPDAPAQPAAEALAAAPRPAEPDGDGGVRALAARLARMAGVAAGTPLAPLALAVARPGGALLRAQLLTRLPDPQSSLDELGHRLSRDGLRFDGRLRVVCVERESGRRVVFGAPGAPDATVAQSVQASCSVPWLYRPVRIGEHEYVDGGLWSPTSIDVAPALRDTHVLCLNPTAASPGVPVPPLGPAAIRVASRTASTVEALALRRRGAWVTVIGPDDVSAEALAGTREDLLAAGFRQGLALAQAG